MNGHWGGGTRVAPPASACSPQQRRVCDEARDAAAWLWLQSEVAAAFERFSKELLAIHTRGLGAITALDTCRFGDSANLLGKGEPPSSAVGSTRDAFNSLLLLCSETAAEADRFSSALISGVIKPVENALESLALAADRAGHIEAVAPQNAAGFEGGGDVQKAARRLQLAEEELTVSCLRNSTT